MFADIINDLIRTHTSSSPHHKKKKSMTEVESTEALHIYRVVSKVVVTPAVLYLDKRNIIFLEGVDKRQADIVQEPPKHLRTLRNDTYPGIRQACHCKRAKYQHSWTIETRAEGIVRYARDASSL